jgi:hypothetical protein
VGRYMDQVREVIKSLHGAEAKHVESAPVKETFQGRTVWEGVVEVFDVVGHARASRAYAWTHEADGKRVRLVTLLHIPPVDSTLAAVRASIVKDFRDNEAET